MHRPLDPNTGKPLPVVEPDSVAKGSRSPIIKEVSKPKLRQRSRPKQTSTTTKEKKDA